MPKLKGGLLMVFIWEFVRKYLMRVGLLMSIILLIGCATQKAWQYGAEPEVSSAALINKSVSIPPFSDKRINENSNYVGLYLIPLMPFGWQDLNTPEGVQMHITSGLWLWRPNEDIAKATAEEIAHAHIFKETFFTHRSSEGELVLQGTINSTKYDGKMITYGLSVEGPLLWFVGFPSSYVNNELSITLKLKDEKNNVVLWEKDYREEDGSISWIYSLQSDFEYPRLLKRILLNAVGDLKSNLGTIGNKISSVKKE